MPRLHALILHVQKKKKAACQEAKERSVCSCISLFTKGLEDLSFSVAFVGLIFFFLFFALSVRDPCMLTFNIRTGFVSN